MNANIMFFGTIIITRNFKHMRIALSIIYIIFLIRVRKQK